jgi:proline iminopeptidase
VLVVHGGPGIPPYQPWKGLEAIDGLRCQFYYYHQRGCGNSTHPVDRFISRNYYRNMVALDGLLGMSAQLADIERIRRILGVEKITLIGHSYGGLLAALYAIEYPDRVEKLVLVSPAATITMPPLEGGRDRVRQYLPDAEKKRYDDFLKHYFDYGKIFSKSETELAALNGEYARYYVKALENAGVHVPEPISRLNGIGGWMVHALYLAAGRKYDYRLLLRRIQAPTLVVHGSRDIVPESVSRAYADGIPGARFEVLPGASHFAYDECPDEFAQAVGGFLEG